MIDVRIHTETKIKGSNTAFNPPNSFAVTNPADQISVAPRTIVPIIDPT